MSLKVFIVAYSDDGKVWTRAPEADDDNYWWTARHCRERSRTLQRFERIDRNDSGDIIVTFKDGIAVSSDGHSSLPV